MSVCCQSPISIVLDIGSCTGRLAFAAAIAAKAVFASEPADRLREYMEELGVEWIMCSDTVGVSRKYDISILPTIVIIDQNGYIRFRHAGLVDEATISQKLAQLL